MRHLIEAHLEEVGPRRSLLLVVLTIAWLSILAGVIVWAAGFFVMQTVWITLGATAATPAAIAVATAWWAFLAASAPLAFLARRLWRQRQDERWRANRALDAIEERSDPKDRWTRHVESPHERLAVRALERLELDLLGAVAERGAVEPRLIRLAAELEPPSDPAARPYRSAG